MSFSRHMGCAFKKRYAGEIRQIQKPNKVSSGDQHINNLFNFLYWLFEEVSVFIHTLIFLCMATAFKASIFDCCAVGSLEDSSAARGAGGCEPCDKFILNESRTFVGIRTENAAKMQPLDFVYTDRSPLIISI